MLVECFSEILYPPGTTLFYHFHVSGFANAATEIKGDAGCTPGVIENECHFPFNYDGVWYDKCTSEAHHRPWCFVRVDETWYDYWRNCGCQRCACHSGEYTLKFGIIVENGDLIPNLLRRVSIIKQK